MTVKNNSWTQRNRNWTWGVSLALVGALSAPAMAQSGMGTGGGSGGGGAGIFELKLAPGVSKRQTLRVLPSGAVRATRNLGDGVEHAVVAPLSKDKLMVVWSSSDVGPNSNAAGVLKCSTVQMSATGVPTIVADQVQLTFGGNAVTRFGRPYLAVDPTTQKALVSYGSNGIRGNNNTQTYATVVDSSCKDLLGGQNNHVVLNDDPNNNEAAPHAQLLRPSTATSDALFFFSYYSNNNNANYVELVSIKNNTPTLITDAQKGTNSNQGRPFVLVGNQSANGLVPARPDVEGIYATAPVSFNRAITAIPEGNNRPMWRIELRAYNADPAAIVTNNGRRAMPLLFKQFIVNGKQDPTNIGGTDGLPGPLGGDGSGTYVNRPQLASGANGEIFMSYHSSNGQGRRRNAKGTAESNLLVMKITDTAASILSTSKGVALDNSHVALTQGLVGTTDAPVQTAALLTASAAGFSTAGISFVQHSAPTGASATGALTQMMTAAASSNNADSAYLSNMLGENPGTQGGGHLRGIGDVPNLAYGAGGFMPHVKTFMVMPVASRLYINPATTPKVQSASGLLPEDRNALFLSFVPALRDPQQAPPPPATGNTGGGVTPGSPGTPGDPGTPGTPGTPGGGSFSSGCSMASNGAGASGAGFVFLALAGIAFIVRRRWS
jgi:MYXO-CTERM domain-containing protein